MDKIGYIEKEQKVLDKVIMSILRGISKYSEGADFAKKYNALIREYFQEAGYSDAKSFITEAVSTVKNIGEYKEKLTILEKSIDRPYFGKIELKEKGNIYISDTLHMGIIGHEPKIVSWKDRDNNKSAGIVKIYYNSNVVPKDVSWLGGYGKIINDTLVGKLQIDIDGNKITDLPIFLISGMTETEQSNQWIDAIRKILEVNTKFGDINQIVRTISAEEFEIIELPFNKSMHIQGAAGTGKTQIALHRISYIIFNRSLGDEDFNFFSPNKFLLKSIEKVLPSLGDTNLSNIVYDDILAANLQFNLPNNNKIELFSNFLKGYYAPGSFNQKEYNSISYKMSNDFLQFLDDKISYHSENPYFIDDLELPRVFSKVELTKIFIEGLENGEAISSIIERAISVIVVTSKLKFDDEKIRFLKRSLLTVYHNTLGIFESYKTLNKHNLWDEFLDDSTRTDGVNKVLFSSDLDIDNIFINCFDLNSLIKSSNKKLSKEIIQEITKLICIENFIDLESDLSVRIYDKLMDLSKRTSILRQSVDEVENNSKFRFLNDYRYDTKIIRKERLNNLYKETQNFDYMVHKISKENNLDEDIVDKELKKINNIKSIKKIYEIFLNDLKNAARNSFDSNSTEIAYEDAIALQYLYFELNGYPTNNEQLIIIDEVQDYNAIQLKTLKKMYTKAHFNVFGDVNQNINPYQEALNPEDINKILDIESTKELTYSYRSTNEIIDYSNSILGISINSIRGKSNIDVVDLSVDKKDMSNQLLADLKKLVSRGYESIAVIVKDIQELEEIEKLLNDNLEKDSYSIIKEEHDFVFSKINILPAYYAKGLEFDSVIVYNTKQNPYHIKDKNIFYTVCTRSKHELIIYNNRHFK